MSLTSLASAAIHSDHILLLKLLAIILLFPIARKFINRIQRYASTQAFKAKHNCQPIRQFPVKDPLLGLDYMMGSIRAFNEKRLLDTISERFRTVGYTFSVRGFHRRTIFTGDAENIKTIMSLRFEDFIINGRAGIMGPLLGKGIFTTDGDEWAHSRAFLRPYFAKENLADLSLFEGHINHLFNQLPKDTSTVDVNVLLHRLTLDSATEFLFGKSTNTLANPREIDLQFEKSLRFSLNHMGFLMVAGPLRRFHKKNPTYLEATRVCRAYVDTFVEDVISMKNAGTGNLNIPNPKAKPGRDSFLKELAMATDDKDKIRGELLSLLLAGRDTSASLLSNLVYSFARRPDVWAKVQEEVKQFGGELPTYKKLRDLKYIRYCINESLRIHPSVVVSAKTAVRDTVLPHGGGPDGKAPVFVPKGRKVVYSTSAMHRNKEVYGEDADEFRPERWETLRVTWEYLPFNGGPRACLGQQYAITEALYVVVRFAQEFDYIESRDDSPWTECLGLTASPERVLVALHRQRPNEKVSPGRIEME